MWFGFNPWVVGPMHRFPVQRHHMRRRFHHGCRGMRCGFGPGFWW